MYDVWLPPQLFAHTCRTCTVALEGERGTKQLALASSVNQYRYLVLTYIKEQSALTAVRAYTH